MSRHPTLWDLPNAISLPELECGATLSGSQTGMTKGQFGPEAAHAQVSALQVKAQGLQTLVTSGRYGSTSSASADLEQSLVNRLMERLDTAGSTLYRQTWKRKNTPLRRRYWALVAQERPIDDTGYTSSLTPTKSDYNATQVQDAQAYSQKKINRKGSRSSLALIVQANALVPLATPSARDWKDSPGIAESGVDPDGSTRFKLDQLPRQAQLADSGAIAIGGLEETKKSGQLNPEYSRWLMGLPKEWCDCALTAMQSLPKLRKRS